MPGYKHLYIPGPTNIPEQVRMAMNVPMEDMSAPDFPDFTKPIFEKVAKIFRDTTGQVFVYPYVDRRQVISDMVFVHRV